ncbi:polyprenyl synthetase family protein [Ignatzschineria ureiclastica]|uniref:Polyprenyl synthetase family protein n=2 Tax=Ignatzschineria ureiclastica TaxID=472582 RepID=A0A2U2AEX2_9GAMM|nr:farnesyl diphosphate synthase [Ignatzschineria ureiclastica]PWD81129.1 polyprenyl synthetase family protein [Ignatzschineria ureiclastica]GGZ96463.1 farnesyl-diphosphate synthase [Ignatzschineria ureiclastica]
MPTAWFSQQLSAFEVEFVRYLTAISAPDRLKEAMLYSTLNGGKRLRALLVIASGELNDAPKAPLTAIAIAIEMIHAYSLIHDDLPAMDDDDYRRGKLTCHKAFDEATAILAGDALLTQSFDCLSHIDGFSAEQLIQLIQLISHASGSNGMVGGQIFDIEAEERTVSLVELERIHHNKTGALIKAAILAGVIAGNGDNDAYQRLSIYADNIGLAFQIKDDILDVTGTQEELGKKPGADQLHEKSTYISLLGLEASIEKLDQLIAEAIKQLEPFGTKATPLIDLANYIQKRNH